jgi:hypothetical protein
MRSHITLFVKVIFCIQHLLKLSSVSSCDERTLAPRPTIVLETNDRLCPFQKIRTRLFERHDLSIVIHSLEPTHLRLRGGVDSKARGVLKAFKLPLNIEKGKTNSAIRLHQMQQCPKDPKVAEEGCAELWRICLNAEKQDRIGRHKNGCRALISVLQVIFVMSKSNVRDTFFVQNFKSNAEVIHEAFALAANLAFAQPKNPFGMNGWAHLFNQVNQLPVFQS